MPFGGGGGGGTITAHKHTNNFGDGGTLEELVTLVDNQTMKTWVDEKIPFVVLDNYEAIVQENNHTFTPSSPLSWDDFSEFVIVIDGEQELNAQQRLFISWNAANTNYTTQLYRNVAGSITGFSALGQSNAEIISTTIMLGEMKYGAEVRLRNEKSNGRVTGFVIATTSTTGQELHHIGNTETGVTSISEISVGISGGDWKVGSRISIYGIRR